MSKKNEFKLIDFLVFNIRKINKKIQSHTTKKEKQLEKIKKIKNIEFDKLDSMKDIIVSFFKR